MNDSGNKRILLGISAGMLTGLLAGLLALILLGLGLLSLLDGFG